MQAEVEALLLAGAEVLRAATPEAVALSRRLARGAASVWATLPPSGHLLALKEVDASELLAEYEARIEPLVNAGPDAILIQSLADPDEALVALQAARRVCKLPVVVSMVFGSGADQNETILRHSCEDVARRLHQEGADGIGCDCGITLDDAVLVVRLMRAESDRLILACPDAGQRELDGDQVVYRETPELFASKIGSLVSAGANVVGGCCGIGADHIAASAQALKAASGGRFNPRKLR